MRGLISWDAHTEQNESRHQQHKILANGMEDHGFQKKHHWAEWLEMVQSRRNPYRNALHACVPE